MTPEQYFTKLSFVAHDTATWKSRTGRAGDRCVLLVDVLKFIAALEKEGITISLDDIADEKPRHFQRGLT